MSNRKQNRLEEFDYSQGYWYFVTVCVKDMITFLGKVDNGKIILNKYGRIVEDRIKWLAQQYIYVEVDSYVIMPNHIHAVIIIDRSTIGTSRDFVPTSEN